MWVFDSLWVSRPLRGPWTSSTHFSFPHKPFPLLVHHPWASTCQPCKSFILHGNLVPHHCLTPLAIILLCWAFSKIICVGFMGLIGAIYRPTSIVKRTRPTQFAKGLQVHTLCFCSNCKRNLNNFVTFTPPQAQLTCAQLCYISY